MTDGPPPPEMRVVQHPRDAACQEAGAELVAFVADWRNRHRLSAVEALYVLHVLSGRTLQAMAVAEREGLNQKPGGGT